MKKLFFFFNSRFSKHNFKSIHWKCYVAGSLELWHKVLQLYITFFKNVYQYSLMKWTLPN